MKTKFLISLTAACIFSLLCYSQEINRTRIDDKSQLEVLIGKCDRVGLKSDLFKTYFEPEYASYNPDAATITSLKSLLANKNVKVIIVMGSWCGDSQEQVPRFYKIADAIGLADTNITLYCVDRAKKSDKGETDNLKITLVPTFIFYIGAVEIGRITETPQVSLEKDLLGIISQ